MNYPLRENLEAAGDSTGTRIRCARCGHVFCRMGEDWKNHCKRRTFPPAKAGPLTQELVGRYLLEKLYCPACGVLLDSDMIQQSGAAPIR
jgi:acetone carboxylase gamma subunit